MARTDRIEMLQGDYAQRLEVLWAAASAALNDESPRTALEEDPYVVLKADYDELRAEALSTAKVVDIAAVGRKAWRELKAKHPIRSSDDADAETVKADRIAGVNVDTIEDDLVFESVKAWQIHANEVVPHGKSRAGFDEWADGLSEGEWQTVVRKAWELTNGSRIDPKELPSSPTRNDG